MGGSVTKGPKRGVETVYTLRKDTKRQVRKKKKKKKTQTEGRKEAVKGA